MADMKKDQVAMALYDLPGNSISNNMIKWILSHLPDSTNAKGEYKEKSAPEGPELQFINNPKLHLHSGFGLSYEDLMKIKDKITALLPEEGDPDLVTTKQGDKGIARVVMMEKLLPQLCESERVFMMALGLQSTGEYIMREQQYKEMGMDELDDLNDDSLSGKQRLEKFIKVLTKLKDKLPDNDEGGEIED